MPNVFQFVSVSVPVTITGCFPVARETVHSTHQKVQLFSPNTIYSSDLLAYTRRCFLQYLQ